MFGVVPNPLRSSALLRFLRALGGTLRKNSTLSARSRLSFRLMGLGVLFRSAYWVPMLIGCGAVRGQGVVPVPYIYTEAPRYDSAATLKGGERFPAGAALQLVAGGGRRRALAGGLGAPAHATVSVYRARRRFF